MGREAVKLLEPIECYPDGVLEGTQMAQACLDVNLRYLPSWEINGEVLSLKKFPSHLLLFSILDLSPL